MSFTFDKHFRISSRALYLNKSHPRIKRDLKWLINLIIKQSIMTAVFVVVMYNIIYVNIENNDFDGACKNGVIAIVYIVITFQYFVMSWKQDVMSKIIGFMEEDYNKAKHFSIEEQEIVEKYVKAGAYVCKQWLLIGVGGCMMFPMKTLVLSIYQWSIGEPKLIPMMELTYPAFIEYYKDNFVMYLGINLVLFFFDFQAAVMYIGFVPLCPVFLIHVCGQLELVEKKIKVLFNGSLEEATEMLKEIVQRLQYIYGFVDQILSAFQVIYECTLRATTFILPVTFYEMIEAVNKGDVPLEFLSFLVGGLLISSSPCYYSDLMMEMSEKVRIAMYTCGWESVPDRKVRSIIRIILTRTLKPVAIQTLFRTICLETLADMLRQSYALFNLMNSMWK